MPGHPHSSSWPGADSPRQSSGPERGRQCALKSPSFEPGRLLMLPAERTCLDRGWVREDGRHRGIFNHPVVMIDEDRDSVLVVIVSSMNDCPLSDKTPHVRMQHLPIHPKPPHPDTGELLRVVNGSADKASFVKVHEKYWFPKKIFGTNTDRNTGEELKLSAESLTLVIRAVADFKHDDCKDGHSRCRAGKETPRNTCRPYPDLPETLGPVSGIPSGRTAPPPSRSPPPPPRPHSWPNQQHYSTPPPRQDRANHEGSWRRPRDSPPYERDDWRQSPPDYQRSRNDRRQPRDSRRVCVW